MDINSQEYIKAIAPDIAKAYQLGKEQKYYEAYNVLVPHFEAKEIPSYFEEPCGWTIYRYLKNNENKLSSLEIRKALSFYLSFASCKPSTLHSCIMVQAANLEKKHENDFRFVEFCQMWNLNSLREEDYIAAKGLGSKIGVIYNSQDPYSSGIYAKFASEAEVKGLEVVAAEAFTDDSKQDFSVQLQKIKSAGADLVFLPIYATEAALILSQAANAGLETKFFGCDGLDGVLNVENFDTALAEGVMLLTPFAKDASDEATQNFVKAYLEEYNNDETYLIQFAADAYDCIYAVKAAAEKANINADMSSSEICDALVAVMGEISVDGVTGAGITWSADGEPNKEPKGVVIEDGSYKAMD